MAKKFLTGLTLVNLDSDPLSGSEGELYFNTSASVAKIYKAGAWTELGVGSGGGAAVSISETAPELSNIGDLWYQASTGSFSVYDGDYWVEINGVIENTLTQEEIQDYIAPLFEHSNHVNITAVYNDSSNEIVLTAGAGYTDEEAQDAAASLFTHLNHTNITASYDDENNQILLSADANGITISNTAPESPNEGDGWFNNENGSFYLYDGAYWVEVNGIVSVSQEQMQDYIAPLFTHSNHTNITVTYDDANNEILLEALPGYTDEQAIDAVAAALVNASANSNVVVTYDDENNVINLNTSGSITNIDSIVYPDYITFDTTPETNPTEAGSIYWDEGESAPGVILNANVDLKLGQQNVVLVKNNSGAEIAKGSVVYINGAQGQRPTIALSDADAESTSSKTLGIVSETLIDGAEGFVTTFGVVRGVNTDGLTEGSALWLSSTAGVYTTTVPTSPQHMVFIGYVVKANASSGEIFVNPQNGYEIEELHNVLINGVSDNQALVYNSSASLWQNESLVNSLSGTENEINVSASIGNITIGLPDDVTIANDLTVLGNLTVSGSTTSLNTTELLVEDNLITLNSGVSGSPSLDAGIEIERGDSDNVQIRWNETNDVWEYTNDGITYLEIGSGAGTTVSSSAPEDPTEGMMWFNTTDNILYVYDGTYWIEVNSIIENTYPDQTGNSGKFLTTNGTIVSWASVDALPDQTDNAGKYLTTSGSAAYWAEVAGAVYQDTAPEGVPTGTIWVDSDATSDIINSNDFTLKSEVESYVLHSFLLMGG